MEKFYKAMLKAYKTVQKTPVKKIFVVLIAGPVGRVVNRAVKECCLRHVEEALTVVDYIIMTTKVATRSDDTVEHIFWSHVPVSHPL